MERCNERRRSRQCSRPNSLLNLCLRSSFNRECAVFSVICLPTTQNLVDLLNPIATTMLACKTTSTSWSRPHGMRFNSLKCRVIHFGSGNQRHTYRVDGCLIIEAKDHRDLGIMVQENLKPSIHVANVVKKANAILDQIKRTFLQRDRERTFMDIYKAFVRPHLEFAASAWNPWMKKDVMLLEVFNGEL